MAAANLALNTYRRDRTGSQKPGVIRAEMLGNESWAQVAYTEA